MSIQTKLYKIILELKATTEITNIYKINPLVPDAHYSERQDKLASLQKKIRRQQILNWQIFIFPVPKYNTTQSHLSLLIS